MLATVLDAGISVLKKTQDRNEAQPCIHISHIFNIDISIECFTGGPQATFIHGPYYCHINILPLKIVEKMIK